MIKALEIRLDYNTLREIADKLEYNVQEYEDIHGENNERIVSCSTSIGGTEVTFSYRFDDEFVEIKE